MVNRRSEPIEFHIIDMKDDASPERCRALPNTALTMGTSARMTKMVKTAMKGQGRHPGYYPDRGRIIARRILELVSPEGRKPARIFDKAKGDYRKGRIQGYSHTT